MLPLPRLLRCHVGPFSRRSSLGSRHAQPGALLHQMFIVGRTEEGSSNDPARTAVTSGLADAFANRGDPHLGQKRCRISLPLCAVLTNSVNCPAIASAAVGTSKFTMPLADMCWQSRHQQTLVASGSAERRKRTAPQRQCPVLSVMGPSRRLQFRYLISTLSILPLNRNGLRSKYASDTGE
jgi:hypothetical protein